MELSLFVHNLGFVLSALLSLVLAVIVFVRGKRKLPNLLFAATSFTFVAYVIFYLLGVNEPDPYKSQYYLNFTLVLILTVSFNAHLAFAMFNKVREKKNVLQLMYASGIALILFFSLDPIRYLATPTEYGYLYNFYAPGSFHWLFTLYFFVVILYFFTTVYSWYTKAEPGEKNRMKYFLVAFGWAYALAAITFGNIYGLFHIDMIYLSLIGLYAIPLAYGVFKYDVIDIHIAAKNAFLYAFYSLFVGSAIIIVNLFNNYVTFVYGYFPVWLLPLISGVIVVVVSWFVWRQIRESDVLKYEFINNISHKFRTPLTHIRWLAEDLRTELTPEERNKAVEQIQYASMRLFELTNIVIDASQNNNDLYLYHFSSVSVGDIIHEIYNTHKDQTDHKLLKVHIDIGPDVPQIKADKTRLLFALQILYENALVYTKEGGEIHVKVRQIGGEVIISIKDNGIGISADDLPHVFSKFYRSQNARHTDTEGMGIGLFMAKNIVEKHNGRIWAESYGEDKGSMFSVALPL